MLMSIQRFIRVPFAKYPREKSWVISIHPKLFYSILKTSEQKSFNKMPSEKIKNSIVYSQMCPSRTSSTVCLKRELLCGVSEPMESSNNKVTVIGAGMVGVACANSILFQRISSHITIVDVLPKKLQGEGMDYCHGSVFLDDPLIEYDTDFRISSNSKIVIVTAGARPSKGETRLDLCQKNANILKSIIPGLVQYSPDAVFIIVSNPVDVLSWVTWKIGNLPAHKVIGCGSLLDSARFRFMIANKIGVSPKSVNGYVIGEHGDSQVPLWSGLSVAGTKFRDILPSIGLETDEEKWNDVTKDLIKSGATVRRLKGYTNTAVGLAVAGITNDVLRNTQAVKPVSTLIQGHYGIRNEIFLSLPCTIGEDGVSNVIRVRMTEHERRLYQKSAKIVYDAQKTIEL